MHRPALVFGEAHVADTLRAEGLGETFERLEAQPLIDWPAAAHAKHRLLRALFEQFIDARWRRCGWTSQASAPMAASCWRSTPCSRRCMRSTARPASAIGAAGRWICAIRAAPRSRCSRHRTSARCCSTASCNGWPIARSPSRSAARAPPACASALIGDLAVGMDPNGSHAWSRQDDVLAGLSIGAPPDLFNPRGQDWGLTGFSPRALTAGGFAPFLATLRAALRNAGGVRIDHAMGLTRLWLIPEGADPADGAYLAYPLGDLLRLLALESQRHGAIVVGEDLGTVPGGFREELEIAGLHGMRVLWFERNGHGIQSA